MVCVFGQRAWRASREGFRDEPRQRLSASQRRGAFARRMTGSGISSVVFHSTEATQKYGWRQRSW